jgi:hypothetical protein
MSGFRVEGNTSGNVAEVNSNNELKVNLSSNINTAGYATLITENDNGAYAGGTPQRFSPAVSSDKRLQVGLDTPLFDSAFTATAQDTGVWRYYFTTMTATQAGGYITFNASSLGTSTIGSGIMSWRQFSMTNNGGLRLSFVAGPTIAIAANQIAEFGWFLNTTPTVSPTEGVYFRVTSAGIV